MCDRAAATGSPAAAGDSPVRSSNIARCFQELARSDSLGLIAYLTAGDPSLEASYEIILAAIQAGADLIELGVPFSDPVADGPVIQRASQRALRSGTNLRGVLQLLRRIRRSSAVPAIIFSYFNPILQMGLERFAGEAAACGADGVLVTDLIPEEAAEYGALLRQYSLDTVFLGAPTSTEARLRLIAESSRGFLYLISRTGVTGERAELPDDLAPLVRRARACTKLPLAVGFGISQPAHISALAGLAEAAVVGSALVAEVENATAAQTGAARGAARAVADRIGLLKSAIRGGSRASQNRRILHPLGSENG